MTLEQVIALCRKYGKTKRVLSGLCKNCGKLFYRYNIRNQTKCSPQCRGGKYVTCTNCKKLFYKIPKLLKLKVKRHFCSKLCFNKYNVGKNHHQYKGGFCIDQTTGYRLKLIDGKYISEHRYVMEKKIGRKLKRSEIVHHMDKNKLNNKISNLQLMTVSGHSKLHSKNGDYFHHKEH